GREAVGVGQRERAEGGFPPVHGRAFDEPPGSGALVAGPALLLRPLPGAFVLDVADGQPEQLDHRVVVREVPPILDDLPKLEVQRLDRVRGVNDPAELGWERQERGEPLTGVLPRSAQAYSHVATAAR